MICLKVPAVGARLAGGACAAATMASVSTITTNIASLVFIAVPRSGQPGELRVDQLVQRDVVVFHKSAEVCRRSEFLDARRGNAEAERREVTRSVANGETAASTP